MSLNPSDMRSEQFLTVAIDLIRKFCVDPYLHSWFLTKISNICINQCKTIPIAVAIKHEFQTYWIGTYQDHFATFSNMFGTCWGHFWRGFRVWLEILFKSCWEVVGGQRTYWKNDQKTDQQLCLKTMCYTLRSWCSSIVHSWTCSALWTNLAPRSSLDMLLGQNYSFKSPWTS